MPVDLLTCSNPVRAGGEDDVHTKVLAEIGESALPPIIVHRPSMQVVDGMHRLMAARSRGARTIRARFFDGGENEAFVFAVLSNISHGLPLSLADRKAASQRIIQLYPFWSDRKIAEVTGLAHKTVGAIRRRSADGAEVTHRLGRDGRIRQIHRNPVAPQKEPAEPATAAIVEQDDDHDAEVELTVVETVETVESVESVEATADEPETAGESEQDELATARAGGRGRSRARTPIVGGIELVSAMQKLRADPSLRFTESGRALLRWLDATPRTVEESLRLADQVPGHCAGMIAAIATQNAQVWQSVAVRIDSRMQVEARRG